MKLKVFCFFILLNSGVYLPTVYAQELVKDIMPGAASGVEILNSDMAEFKSMLFFRASDLVHDSELWKSNGTTAGTVLLKDINPGHAIPSNLKVVNDMLYFAGVSEEHGNELWKTDGTAAGTQLVKDFNPEGSSNLYSLTAFNDSLFLEQYSTTSGGDKFLYKTNGTEEGTVPVQDENGDPVKVAIYYDLLGANMLMVGDILYFLGTTESYGRELWMYSGGVARMVKDITPGPASTSLYDLTDVNGTLFFATLTGLWKSDGTAAGTVQLSSAVPSPNPEFNMLAIGNTLFFVEGGSDTLDYELWKSDGTEAGTQLVKNINPSGASDPKRFTDINGALYFTAFHPDYGTELWKSDGTTEGTNLVKDINPGVAGSNPLSLTNINGALYFTATNVVAGRELWRHSGTSTSLLFEIIPGPSGGDPRNLIKVGGTLFFTAFTPETGRELWKYSLSAPLIPERLRNYQRFEQSYWTRERDWCWTGIFIDWQINPACGENNIPCPEEFFGARLISQQKEVVWQESFTQPLQREIPVPDTQPFRLQVFEGKENPQEIISLDPFLVPLGITNVQMGVYPQEGFIALQVAAEGNEQIPLELALVNEQGDELWASQFTAPFEGQFDDQVAGTGVKFRLKPAENLHAKVFDLHMRVLGSENIIPIREGDEIDAAAFDIKLFKLQLGKAPVNVRMALFKLYRNDQLISVGKDFNPKFMTLLVLAFDGDYKVVVELFTLNFFQLHRLYNFEVNFSMKNTSWTRAFLDEQEVCKLFPNPVQDKASLYLMLGESSETTLTIFSYKGEVVMEKSYPLHGGKQQIELDLRSLAPGLYQCMIKDQSWQKPKVLSFIKR